MGRLKRFKPPKIVTVIGIGSTINGDLCFSGGLHVDGVIHGNVMADDDPGAALILSEQGVVEGDVNVPNVILNGNVVGDVHSSNRVELAPNARVTGTLYYKLLEMAMGAEVNGQLISSDDPAPTPVEPRKAVKSLEAEEGEKAVKPVKPSETGAIRSEAGVGIKPAGTDARDLDLPKS
ncbi:MAG: polymer-forming cytoskeletal protein [Gammaproteobacteria bacterium]|nr:polymer-forming cytoskeletal protein [Gammaproteobacteria bacterium]